MTAVASRVEAQISGTVSGQIAVGNHIIQNNVDHGGVVYVAAPGETPVPRQRPLPVVLRGRRARELLGRDDEVRAASDGLEESSPVDVVGPAGIGKTTVLKYLVHNPPQGAATDGAVYHEAHGEAVEDSLQFLYEAFYETNVPFKPTEAQLRHALRDIRALVVLDDLDVGRNGAAQLLDSLPAANFVLGGARRSLWGGGCTSVPLRGLERDASVELLARELGRDMTARDRQVAAVIAEAVGGEPLRLVQVAALVADLGYELTELADDLRRGSGVDEVGRLLLESLDYEQRRILEVLSALGGATLPADQLAELTGVDDAGPVLASLMRLGLVQAHSPRYSVAAAVGTLTAGEGSARADEAARAHFVRWLEARSRHPQAVVEETQAVLAVVRTAARDQAWADLLRLGRAAEGPFLLSGRWGAWREVVEHELTAARRLGDRAAEGWALHQIGSRALCLEDRSTAGAALTDALRIRRDLGDHHGAEVTRHNLDLLEVGHHTRALGPRAAAPKVHAGGPLLGLPFFVLLAVLVLLGVLLAGIAIWAAAPGPVVRIGALGSLPAVEPAVVEFGDRATGTSSAPRAVTMSNNGTTVVMVRDVSVTGGAPASYRIDRDGCTGVALGHGDSCSVSVVFAPADPGAQQATLRMAGDGVEVQAVALSGAGTRSPAAAQPQLRPGRAAVPTAFGPRRPDPPIPAPVVDLQVPASQAVAYGAVLRLSATATSAVTPTLAAAGSPLGVSFVDRGDGTGVFSGTVLAAPGSVPITVTATAGPVVVQRSFTLTIVPADVTLQWTEPVLSVAAGQPVVADALVTRVGGTQGDLTLASVMFDVVPCTELGTGPVPVDPSGRAALALPGLPPGTHAVQARLVNSPYFRLISAQPLVIVASYGVPGLLSNVISVLSSDTAAPTPGPPSCQPQSPNSAIPMLAR